MMKVKKYRVYSDAFEEEGGEFYKVEDMEIYFDLNRPALLKHLSQVAIAPVCENASLEVMHQINTRLTQQLQIIAPVAEKMLKTHNDNLAIIETQGKRIAELVESVRCLEDELND